MIEDRTGERAIWEGDLPGQRREAESGVERVWREVEQRRDELRGLRDPSETPNAPAADAASHHGASAGAWSDQVERLAIVLTGLDLTSETGPAEWLPVAASPLPGSF